MNNVIEVSNEEQFAKGQDGRDLQVCWDVGEVETQFLDVSPSDSRIARWLRIRPWLDLSRYL